MIDFSDIFEEGKEKKEEGSSGQAKEEKEPTPEEENQEQAAKQSQSPLKFSTFFDKQDTPKSPTPQGDTQPCAASSFATGEKQRIYQAEKIYNRAVAFAEKIFAPEGELRSSDLRQLQQFIEQLVEYILQDEQQLVEYVFRKLSGSADVFILNPINVCILSLEAGVGLGYSRSQLLTLGLAAFLHDIGLKNYRNLLKNPQSMTAREKEIVQQHSLAGAEMLRRIQVDIDPAVLEIIEQGHERIDGSGYPGGLKGEEISEYAQIVGLVDMYEELIHQQPRRDSQTCLESLKVVLEHKEGFSQKIIKAFLERIGLYPKGTMVELNTKEVAQVVAQNQRMPCCPIVSVVYDHEGKKMNVEKKIDLSRGTKIYITKSL